MLKRFIELTFGEVLFKMTITDSNCEENVM